MEAITHNFRELASYVEIHESTAATTLSIYRLIVTLKLVVADKYRTSCGSEKKISSKMPSKNTLASRTIKTNKNGV